MWLLYIVGIVLVGSFGAIIGAFVVMKKQSKLVASIEEISIRAEVIGCTDGQSVSYQIYDPYKLGAKRMSIVFLTDKDQYIRLNVNQKDFYRLQQGMYGTLTYHANKLITFKRLIGHEESRLQQKLEEHEFLLEQQDLNSNIVLYCDMPSIGITIPTSEPIPTTREQVFDLIDKIYDNTTENFFGLDDGTTVVQFTHDGISKEVLLDIPIAGENRSYQAIFHDAEILKEVVEAFFEHKDLVVEYELEIQKL